MLSYNMGEQDKVAPKELVKAKGFELRLYDPKFPEFTVTQAKVAGKGVMALQTWSIMIVIRGKEVELLRTEDKSAVRAGRYSTWLLPPGNYEMMAEEEAEVYIASEGVKA